MSIGLKIAITIICIFFAGTVLFFLSIPQLVFRFIFARPKRSTKIPKFYIGTPHYNVSQAGLKVMKTLPSEDVFIRSHDGLKLHAYLFPQGEQRKKFVIGIHGYKSYSRPEYAPYIEFYRSLGFSMLLPDDRAHAPSEGKYIGFGVLDRLDCVNWAKYLVKTYGEDIEILLHGVSMGGATVVSASGEEDLPVQVKGIVADCAYTSAQDILMHQIQTMAHLPAKRILPYVEKICQKKAGFDFHSVTPLGQVKKARVPMLFVHGEEDKMVPVGMVDELFKACNADKKLLKVNHAGHGESIAFAPEEYHRAIIELFGLCKDISAEPEQSECIKEVGIDD